MMKTIQAPGTTGAETTGCTEGNRHTTRVRNCNGGHCARLVPTLECDADQVRRTNVMKTPVGTWNYVLGTLPLPHVGAETSAGNCERNSCMSQLSNFIVHDRVVYAIRIDERIIPSMWRLSSTPRRIISNAILIEGNFSKTVEICRAHADR